MAKRKKKTVRCVEYLSVNGSIERVNALENNQRRYIREYVRYKEYQVTKTLRRNGLSMKSIDYHWELIVNLIREGKVDGVVIANMAVVSNSLSDAYRKVGQIVEAGGIVVTVDEGRLEMKIKESA